MYCKTCGNFFQPPPEEEKLITTGGLPVLCPACERKRWQAKEDAPAAEPIYPGMEPVIGTGTVLYRAARFNKNGTELIFVALPPKPRKAKSSPLRKERKNDTGAHVFVMSEHCSQLRTIPRITLHTNIDTYEKYGTPLKVTKVPDFWDPFTGIGEIVIMPTEIVRISRLENIVRVDLTDGGWLSLYYR